MKPGFLRFAVIFTLLAAWLHVLLRGREGLFSVTFWTFGVIPLLDLMIGRDKHNPLPEDAPVLARILRYRALVWLAVPAQIVSVVWASWAAAHHSLTGVARWADLVLSFGIVSGVMAITAAHELVHRSSSLERAAGYFLLFTVGYMHWGIEHVHGHHRWVATPRDPATARLGESFYAFWPRCLRGELRGALLVERERLARLGTSPWSWRNRLLWFAGAEVLLPIGLALGWGVSAAIVWAGQALVAVTLLTAINYVEHYGLLRKGSDADGYERVMPHHAWNASERLTNMFLFNLQRHSDHHTRAAARYHLLRHVDESPQLPTGYAGMLLVALVPPLWFRLMDRRLARPAERGLLREPS
jgi:alkane 1-monooxygenase